MLKNNKTALQLYKNIIMYENIYKVCDMARSQYSLHTPSQLDVATGPRQYILPIEI